MNKDVHISSHKVSTRRGICGQRGEITGYDPTESTCEHCIKLFKGKYPEAWDMWMRKRNNESEES